MRNALKEKKNIFFFNDAVLFCGLMEGERVFHGVLWKGVLREELYLLHSGYDSVTRTTRNG